MRIGLLDVSHWHFPLYRTALAAPGLEVVAVADADPGVRHQVAAEFGAHTYAEPLALLENEALDVAFVFTPHVRMATVATALIERAVPFVIEKPGGMNAAEVTGLRDRAQAKDLFVAVPFVQRLGPVFNALQRLIETEGACFIHSSWRFFGGPPGRYPAMGCDWMLDPTLSGGGCLMNLGPHFVDLALRLHGSANSAVARLSTRLHGSAVEDHATLSLGMTEGNTSLIETGYCFPEHPDKREYSFTLVGERHYVRSSETGLRIYRTGQDDVETVVLDLDADPLYGHFVRRTLADLRSGVPPVAGLADLAAVMQVMDVAYGNGAGH